MRGRRKLAMVAVVALALTGCNSIRRVTSSTYQDGVRCMQQSLSGDGRWLAFRTMDDPSGIRTDQKVVLRGLSDGSSRQIAGMPSSMDNGGTVSTAGGVVVVVIDVPVSGGREGRVYLWNRSSGARTRVSPLGEDAYAARMTDDAKRVVYATQGGAIWLYDATTKARTRMSPAGPTYTSPNISGDGRYVTFASYPDRKVYVHGVSSGSNVALFGSGEYNESSSDVGISDDGRWVTYVKAKSSVTSGTHQVYLWDRTTGKSTRITNAPAGHHMGDPTISGDGSRIAYTELAPGENRNVVRVVKRGGGEVTSIRPNHFAHGPVLSRAGHVLAFCTDATNLVSGSPQAPNVYVWSDGEG